MPTDQTAPSLSLSVLSRYHQRGFRIFVVCETLEHAQAVAEKMSAPRRTQAVTPQQLETWLNTSRISNIPLLDRPTVVVVPPVEQQTSNAWESIYRALNAMPYPLILLETREPRPPCHAMTRRTHRP